MAQETELAEFRPVEPPHRLYRPEIEWNDTLLWHGEPTSDRDDAYAAANKLRRQLAPDVDKFANPVLHDGRGLRIPLTAIGVYAYRTAYLTPMHRACQVAAEMNADSVPVEASAPCVFSGETILWTGDYRCWRTCVNKDYAAHEAGKAILRLRPAAREAFRLPHAWQPTIELFDEECRLDEIRRLDVPVASTELEAWRQAAVLLADAHSGVQTVPLRAAIVAAAVEPAAADRSS